LGGPRREKNENIDVGENLRSQKGWWTHLPTGPHPCLNEKRKAPGARKSLGSRREKKTEPSIPVGTQPAPSLAYRRPKREGKSAKGPSKSKEDRKGENLSGIHTKGEVLQKTSGVFQPEGGGGGCGGGWGGGGGLGVSGVTGWRHLHLEGGKIHFL